MAEFTAAQRKAIDTLDANVAVSAGAGAGKTRVLVERYLNILARGEAACDEILAITFTNKAAKEMKERIRRGAAERAAAGDDEAGRKWRAALAELEYAPIGTFHSFCARVLRENPVEAGLDPNFAVLDEVETVLLTEKALDEVFTAALAADAPWLDSLLKAYDKAMLTAIVPDLYDKIAAQGLLDAGLADRLADPYRRSLAAAAGLKDELLRLCDELIAYKDKLKKTGAQYARVERLARDRTKVAAAVAAVDGDEGADAVLHDYLDSLDRRSGDKDIVAALRETLKRLRQGRHDRVALGLVPAVCRLLAELDAALAVHKREQRVLTFTDLEVRTARLLQDHPAVKQRYLGRIRHIMVDEFQDTNDLQRQIVYLVAGGDAESLRGRKLFIVGDGKQSIYRFRGADVAVFARVCRDIAASGGETIDLDVNFRSLDSLLTLYNECFAAVMGTDEDIIPFQPLAAFRRDDAPAAVRAELLAIAGKGEGGGRKAEAEAIARRIGALVGGAEALVDRDATPRPVKYGDIAVLFRTVTDIDTYAAALQTAGIPYYIVGGRGFYHRQEIVDILNLLQVVENRGNETALAGVLRSPLFLLSDAALLALRQGGASLWRGLENHAAIAGLPAEQRQAADRAWQTINTLRGLRGAVGVSRLIRLALDATGYLNFVLTQFMGQQKYANLLKLAAVADAFESKGTATLGDFLRYVAKLVAGEVREGEAQVESEGGDTVKLMTIHKAKGLEFPVVFLPDLHRRFRDENGPALFSAGQGLGLKVPGPGGELAATSVHEAVAAREKKLALLELKRVLYVAFTRAKDYLVLSAAGDKVTTGKDFTALGTWLGWLGKVYGFGDLAALPDRLAVDQAAILVCSAPGALPAPSCPAAGGAIDEPAAADLLAGLAGRIAALPAVRPATVFTVSAIGKFRLCPRAYYYSAIAGLPEPPAEPPLRPSGDKPPGRIIGDVLHRSLELATAGQPAEEWLARAAEEKAPRRWRRAAIAEVRPLLARYAGGDLFRDIGARPVRKEWQFAFHLPDPDGQDVYQFSGRIDCLVDYRDGSVGIVDYKTDKVTAREAAGKAAEYALQLALYAMAAEAAGCGTVRDARLHFLRPAVTVAVPVDAAAKAAAAEELRAACRHISRHAGEEAYRCDTSWCPHCGFRVLCSGCKPQ